MAPQRLEKIESAPGNGMGSKVANLQDVVHGRRGSSCAPPANGEVAEKAPSALKSLGAELKSAHALRGAAGRARPAQGYGPSLPFSSTVQRAGPEGNFPGCKALKNHETGKRISPSARGRGRPSEHLRSPRQAIPRERLASRSVAPAPIAWIASDHECSGWAGTVNWKTAPRGSFALAHNRPSCASMIERQIDSPIPIPVGLVV